MAKLTFGKIGVLMGGPSTEREISLKSGKAVYESLNQAGLKAIPIDIRTDNAQENIRLIKTHKIDCAFVALHGRFGEDGQIQEILDNLKVPYTGSGAMASKLAMDKIASRRIFELSGLCVPRYRAWDRFSYRQERKIRNNIAFPLVVKPATHGSSIGLSLVDNKGGLGKALSLAFRFDERAIVEEYIEGREVTVGILGDRTLPVIEIIPKRRLFDFEAKYQAGMTDYVVPAKIEGRVMKKIQRQAIMAHRLLGCFGCSRVDMILDKKGIPFVLELNSIPGLTPTSLLPKAALKAGIEFRQLCLNLLTMAYEKKQA